MLLEKGRVERIMANRQIMGLAPQTVQNLRQVISYSLHLAPEQKRMLSNAPNSCTLPHFERKKRQQAVRTKNRAKSSTQIASYVFCG